MAWLHVDRLSQKGVNGYVQTAHTHMGAGYYLAAGGQVAAKPYKLLVEALRRSSRVAIAKHAWSGRERLGMLRVRGGAMVLQELLWPMSSAISPSCSCHRPRCPRRRSMARSPAWTA
ncbi:Ku protein [Streptomyces sp. NPDC001852]|uniref:Ku protein n=1 Tax=Streptomyces sp. NPDC001852 TaxID=3364619 RepID=UPI0036900BB8